jgi:hypothetical protein
MLFLYQDKTNKIEPPTSSGSLPAKACYSIDTGDRGGLTFSGQWPRRIP